jgi:hypothetical protein
VFAAAKKTRVLSEIGMDFEEAWCKKFEKFEEKNCKKFPITEGYDDPEEIHKDKLAKNMGDFNREAEESLKNSLNPDLNKF